MPAQTTIINANIAAEAITAPPKPALSLSFAPPVKTGRGECVAVWTVEFPAMLEVQPPVPIGVTVIVVIVVVVALSVGPVVGTLVRLVVGTLVGLVVVVGGTLVGLIVGTLVGLAVAMLVRLELDVEVDKDGPAHWPPTQLPNKHWPFEAQGAAKLPQRGYSMLFTA